MNCAGVMILGILIPDSRKSLSPVSNMSTSAWMAALGIGRSRQSLIKSSLLSSSSGTGTTSRTRSAAARKSVKRFDSDRELTVENSFHLINVLFADNCMKRKRNSFHVCLEWNAVRKEGGGDKNIRVDQNLHLDSSSFLISEMRLATSSSVSSPAFPDSPFISC